MSIAVFSGPTATIQNTAPLVTSGVGGFQALRPQRLAAPVKVYIEAFSAHPLERDAAELYGPPDGYLDRDGVFRAQATSPDDTAVFETVLSPEDGLYLLPYLARQRDGRPWSGACASPGADETQARQTFFADASRLFEEIDRFGLDNSGTNNLLSRRADYKFFRAAPSAGYTRGLSAAERTDAGEGNIAPEVRGKDFFYYYPPHLAHGPAMPTLAYLTNMVQQAIDSGDFDGAIWLEGSPSLEDTAYWLNLLIDTDIPICGNASQRPHGTVSNDGDRNLVDSVEYIGSRIWEQDGRDSVGVVVVQDQQIFTAREVQKADARPGGYRSTGGHGGIVGRVGEMGQPVLAFRPNKRHTACSEVNLRKLTPVVTGVAADGDRPRARPVEVLDADGWLRADAIPKVVIAKFTRYGMDDFSDDPEQEVEIAARIARNLERFPLAGFVLEGNAPFGRTEEAMTAALVRAALSGMPVVCVGRGDAGGFVPGLPEKLFVAGSNLTATKARMLLMACLLRFGAPTPAADPAHPSSDERAAVLAYVRKVQGVFETH